jgi:hypothetical protein
LIYSSIGLERLRKPTKTLTGKAGLQAEFWTLYLPNTKQER